MILRPVRHRRRRRVEADRQRVVRHHQLRRSRARERSTARPGRAAEGRTRSRRRPRSPSSTSCSSCYQLTSVHNYKRVVAPGRRRGTEQLPEHRRDQRRHAATASPSACRSPTAPVSIGKVTEVYPDQQRRDADHRSPVRRAGAGAQSRRRRRRHVDHVVGPPNTAHQRTTTRCDHSTSTDDNDDDDRRPSPTTTTAAPVGATPGQTTTSTSPTTTTTLPEIVVRRETGDIDGQGADRPLLFSLIDDTALTNVQGRRHRRNGRRHQEPGPTEHSDRQDHAVTRRLGSRSPIVEVEPNASLTQLNFVSVVLFVPEPGRDLSRALAAVCPLHPPDPGGTGGPGDPADVFATYRVDGVAIQVVLALAAGAGAGAAPNAAPSPASRSG